MQNPKVRFHFWTIIRYLHAHLQMMQNLGIKYIGFKINIVKIYPPNPDVCCCWGCCWGEPNIPPPPPKVDWLPNVAPPPKAGLPKAGWDPNPGAPPNEGLVPNAGGDPNPPKIDQ